MSAPQSERLKGGLAITKSARRVGWQSLKKVSALKRPRSTKEDLLFCEDSTDYSPPVEPGDPLSIVRRLPDRALVKRNGVTGWYFGRLGEDVPPKTFFCEKSPGISA